MGWEEILMSFSLFLYEKIVESNKYNVNHYNFNRRILNRVGFKVKKKFKF